MIVISLLQGCVPLEIVKTGISATSLYYAKKASEPRVVSDCNVMEPIYLEGDVEGLTDEDLKQIVTHNEIHKRVCLSNQ